MTPEQKQKLGQVIKRHNQQPPSTSTVTCWNDVDFLLSLVKSQEAPIAIETLKDLHDSDCLYVTHNGACDCAEGVVVNRAAASMRSACVEKVKAMGQQWYAEAKKRGAAFSDKGRLAEVIAKELESLSIEKQSRSL